MLQKFSDVEKSTPNKGSNFHLISNAGLLIEGFFK